ncbi:MAG: 23S rRNA (adenine(2503)-C(2))-methyltransferase RlmN [Pseudomonadota bacterium]
MSETAKTNLLDLDYEQLKAFFLDRGEKAFRATQLMKWIHHRCVDDFDEMTDLSKSLREMLKREAEVRAPEVVLEQQSADGTRKWVLELEAQNTASRNTPAMGNKIEMVFIPEEGRGTLCVSSQVGCSLDCSFCSTARQGFSRNLSAAEIVGQVWQAKRTLLTLGQGERLTNVVMMGMGEPLMNYRPVIQSVNTMMDDRGYGLSKRKVTISTSGIVPAMERMIEDTPCALAVSLHAPDDALRNELVPINRKHPLEELMAVCDRWVEAGPKRSVTYEYVMLEGVNDNREQAHALAKLLRHREAKVNLIPFNPFPNSGYKRSSEARIKEFKRILNSYGVFTFPRKTRGDDIDAACGQLVGKVQDRSRRHLKFAEPRFGERS